MQINQNNKTSFGWYFKMHADIVKNSAKLTDFDKSAMATIEKYVKRPDLDEFFLLGQKHFYYPDSKMKSYCDYTGTHNAKYMYNSHVKKMNDALTSDRKEQSFEEAGRALHYLHDMTQPNHIESGSFIQKIKESINPHHKFEMDIYDRSKKIYANAQPVEMESKTHEELFDEVLNISKNNQKPTMANIDKWDDIAQNAINTATGATKKFLDILSQKI